MKNNIHLVHLSSQFGGIEVLLPEMIRHISDHSFSAFIVRPPKPDEANVYNGLKIPVAQGSGKNIMAFFKLFCYARKFKHDVFHVFNIGPFFLLALRLAGVKKLLYAIHGTIYWRNSIQKYVFRAFWKWAIRRDSRFTCNSNYSGDVFKKNISPISDIQLLYNPISSERFVPDQNKKRLASPKKVVYLGRLARGKNLERWIAVADLLKQHFPTVKFEICGTGPEEEKLRSLIRSKHLEDKVFFSGYLERPEKTYQDADVMMFFSEYESFGNVVVESILCGTPVIASSIPAMKEIFQDFPEFLVEMDENLENNVLQKLKDLEKLNRLALYAREQFSERFGDEVHYKKLRAIYASL
jgi:glycosyltransferase involved in cell wall biosynthesis